MSDVRASVELKSSEAKLRELKRMRAIATLLLAFMTLVFVITTMTRVNWPWVPYVRAFAEAGMVGACADWFAVVALFRRPFGLPIPHTGIVPNNKDRIGAALGQFITNNFLTLNVVGRKIVRVDALGYVARWMTDPKNSQQLAHYASRLLPQILRSLSAPQVGEVLGEVARRGIESIPAAPLAAKVLSIIWAQGQAQAMLDRVVEIGGETLAHHKDFIRQRVAENSSSWIPKWVDNMIADKVMNGLLGTIGEMRNPDHPWRREVRESVDKLIVDLATDPDMYAGGEVLKAELLASPVFLEQARALWTQIESGLHADLSARNVAIEAGFEAAIRGLGTWIDDDLALRARLNRWVRAIVLRTLMPRRVEIGTYIAQVVENWDNVTLVNKLELQVGKDLQYVRINGTVVGGLVGLLIFVVSKWMSGLS
jgi:uncharacterized membrane-anchored protein YjiN (DUF445 family)